MGIFDKIKNALFEEEYVEVEEPQRKKKAKDKPKKEIHKVNDEKPIAKKVVLPEKKEESSLEKETVIDDHSTEDVKEDFKFPMMDEDDFKIEDDYVKEEPEIVKVIEEEPEKKDKYHDYFREEKLYKGKETKTLYGMDEDDRIKMHEYGTYDKHDEKKVFRPSPIISPIYGVLDKNYKKEEIVTKKEVRLTSSYAREHLSVDDVRRKAYGALSDDRKEIEVSDEKEEITHSEEDQLLVDLSSDSEKPQVHEVTMGDAEEYFQDLGLEYNIDYKDVTKEKATGRREKKHYDEVEKEEVVVVDTDIDTEIDKSLDYEEKKDEKENDDDNLFDLIDSMYEEEN